MTTPLFELVNKDFIEWQLYDCTCTIVNILNIMHYNSGKHIIVTYNKDTDTYYFEITIRLNEWSCISGKSIVIVAKDGDEQVRHQVQFSECSYHDEGDHIFNIGNFRTLYIPPTHLLYDFIKYANDNNWRLPFIDEIITQGFDTGLK